MSAFVILVPAIMGGPAFAVAVAVAGAALGLRVVNAAGEFQRGLDEEKTSIDVGMPKNYALAESLDEGESMTLAGNGFKVCFVKDGRGDCMMRVDGHGKTEQELEKLGRNLLNRVSQQYAYEKITKELKKRGFNLVQETVEENQTIRLTVRK